MTLSALHGAKKLELDLCALSCTALQFASERKLPFYFVSASDGTNVVQLFNDAIEGALKYKASPQKNFMNDVVDLLNDVAVAVN